MSLPLICLFPLARCEKRVHLLPWVQGERAASGSRTRGPTGTNLTVALRKLHLDERFACILHGCPTRTGSALWTGHGLRFPIDVEVREVVASLRLIPVRLERGTNQVHSMARLTLHQLGDRDIACIDEMLIWEQFPLSQTRMDRREGPLIGDGSLSGLDMSDQLRSIFVASLREMYLVAHPQRGPFLAIPCVEVIGRVDELSRRQGRFCPLSSPLLSWLKLLRAIWCAGW